MARGLWKGAISFGLVNVPVELHSAKKRSAELDMTMLDKRNLAPVGYKRVNKSTGKEVPWNEVVKGYEYKDDQYVVMSPEDFRRANPEAAKTVDLERLALSPQCGFASTMEGNRVTPEDQSKKLERVVAAARAIWR